MQMCVQAQSVLYSENITLLIVMITLIFSFASNFVHEGNMLHSVMPAKS